LSVSKIILDLCGGTGSWSAPYKEAGYEVINVTLPSYDVRTYDPPENVYGILAAPPCDQLSFARTNAKAPRDLKDSLSIVQGCLSIIWKCQQRLDSQVQKYSPLKFWALENPKAMLQWYLGKPAYVFNPWEFGDAYKKTTCLWGWFKEPKKLYSNVHDITMEDQIKKHLTHSNPLPKFDMMKSKDIHPEQFGKLTRKERRAITPRGFAEAFFKANSEASPGKVSP